MPIFELQDVSHNTDESNIFYQNNIADTGSVPPRREKYPHSNDYKISRSPQPHYLSHFGQMVHNNQEDFHSQSMMTT